MVLGGVIDFVVLLGKLLFLSVWEPIKWLLPKQRKDVSNEIVLITGGGMGMGRLMALEFAQLKATVVIWDVNRDAMNGVVQEIKDQGNSAVFSYVVDVSKNNQVYAAADKVRRDVGDVSILVNNAGLVNAPNFLNVPDERIELLMDVNATSHMWTLKAFLPAMLAKDHGHITTIASSAGLIGVSGMLDYCASKFGAVGLHESVTMEIASLGKTGVKTTLVCPYFVKTGMFEGAASRIDWLITQLTPEYASGRIVDAIRTNCKMLVMPRIIYAFIVLKAIIPTESALLISKYTGMASAMRKFVGRTGKAK
ncbi:epidermal retinol dehydrogenase 2-like [Sycon ciliatum]|uniref:epidermal retinol dehydrogenase 2-like n=1 Tax=Sycon ciliatum TaxID=27933 RepID=UPI0020AB31EF|eukprot:scpid67579/ scgid25087/ Epidermal retinol dehydrogenase 2; Retinal short-chain dehydrogenase reductase 2; Short-chain dehydrogenase reductase 9; Short-chain dehydrogenase/reductase family 16C member 5